MVDYLRDRGRGANAWDDFAVLFRSNMQSRLLEEALREARIPYTVVGSQSFFQNKEIIDAMAFLEATLNPRNDLAFLKIANVPPRGIGEATIDKLRQYRDTLRQPFQEILRNEHVLKQLPEDGARALQKLLAVFDKYHGLFEKGGRTISELARGLFDETGYMNGFQAIYKNRESAEKRQENVFEFLNSMDDYQRRTPDASMAGFLEFISLFDTNDSQKGDDEKGAHNMVTLMTVHASKGLEFDNVIICGMERKLFPHERAMAEGNETEERRLFYVGITRARKNLVLTYAKYRREKNTPVIRVPSMFLDEIPEDCIRFIKPEQAFERVSDAALDDMFAQFLAGG